jgi:LPXTG-site transpeptidase (sortase) family protein
LSAARSGPRSPTSTWPSARFSEGGSDVRRRALGSALQIVGAILLVLSVGTLAYAIVYPRWADSQYAQQQSAEPQEALPEHLDVQGVRVPAPADGQDTRSVQTAPDSIAAPGPRGSGGAAPNPLPVDDAEPPVEPDVEIVADTYEEGDSALESPPRYGPPLRMQIPRIGVNSSVTKVAVANGEYQVPGWDVGHHADSSEPGQPGNSVFNGHLETINAGRVFARLKDLRVGDAVYVYTATHRLDWVIREVRTVPDTEYGFILPTEDTRITLYTCAGRYNPLTRGYTHWLVLTGELVEATPRA